MSDVRLDPAQLRVARHACARRRGGILVGGDAGCGKTTVAARIARWFLDHEMRVLVLAPTHMARLQLENRLPRHDDLLCTTVSSWLGQHPQIDEESGRLKFTRGEFSGVDADLVIVDEVSMVGEHEVREILRAAREALVILLGDFAQLRPVAKRQGSEHERLRAFHLPTQHRNDSDILRLCNRVRTAVEYPEKDSGRIRVHEDRADLMRCLLAEVTRARDPRVACYLAYRNRTVHAVRMRVHRALHGNVPFARGQWMRLDQQCDAGYNGTLVRVLDWRTRGRARLNGEAFVTYLVRVRAVDAENAVVITMCALEDQPRLHAAIEALYERSAAQFARDRDGWKATREIIARATDIVRHSSPFAGTVHKSQGSTIQRVFVDTLDVSTGSDRRRLLYVAYSRAARELNTVRVPARA